MVASPLQLADCCPFTDGAAALIIASEEAARKLTGSGVLALRLTAAEDYISPELAAFLRSIYKTLRAVFPEVTAIPGETVHFFGAADVTPALVP